MWRCLVCIAESPVGEDQDSQGVIGRCVREQEEGCGGPPGGAGVGAGDGRELPPGRHLRAAASSSAAMSGEDYGT